MSLFFYLFTFAISLWHWKFVTAGVTAVYVNNQHGIQRLGQDSEKFIFEGLHSKEVDKRISHGQSCGAAACPLNSKLIINCLSVSLVQALRGVPPPVNCLCLATFSTAH